jgi:hypothetical protein
MKFYDRNGVPRDKHEQNFDSTDAAHLFKKARVDLRQKAKPLLDKLSMGHLRVHVELPHTARSNILRSQRPTNSMVYGNDVIVHVDLQGIRFFLNTTYKEYSDSIGL